MFHNRIISTNVWSEFGIVSTLVLRQSKIYNLKVFDMYTLQINDTWAFKLSYTSYSYIGIVVNIPV